MILRGILNAIEGVIRRRVAPISVAVLGGVAMATHAWPRSAERTAPVTTLSASAQAEIDRVVSEIDRIEAEALATLSQGLPGPTQRTVLLGKLLLFDKQLSVHRNVLSHTGNRFHRPDLGA